MASNILDTSVKFRLFGLQVVRVASPPEKKKNPGGELTPPGFCVVATDSDSGHRDQYRIP